MSDEVQQKQVKKRPLLNKGAAAGVNPPITTNSQTNHTNLERDGEIRVKLSQIGKVDQMRADMNADGLANLIESIKDIGLMQGIVIRKPDPAFDNMSLLKEGQEFVVLLGHHRYDALKELNDDLSMTCRFIPQKIVPTLRDVVKFQLHENDVRSSITLWDRTKSYKLITESDPSLTKVEVAKDLRVDSSQISRYSKINEHLYSKDHNRQIVEKWGVSSLIGVYKIALLVEATENWESIIRNHFVDDKKTFLPEKMTESSISALVDSILKPKPKVEPVVQVESPTPTATTSTTPVESTQTDTKEDKGTQEKPVTKSNPSNDDTSAFTQNLAAEKAFSEGTASKVNPTDDAPQVLGAATTTVENQSGIVIDKLNTDFLRGVAFVLSLPSDYGINEVIDLLKKEDGQHYFETGAEVTLNTILESLK